MPFGTIRNPLTLGASGQSDGSAYRALAESLASQQMQAGPSSGLNVLQAILGPLAQVANMNRAAEADSAYEQNRMKQYEEFQARQAEQERAQQTAAAAGQRAEREKVADANGLTGLVRAQFLMTGEIPAQAFKGPEQPKRYEVGGALVDENGKVIFRAPEKPVAAGAADREVSFDQYQAMSPEQRAAYDQYKGRPRTTDPNSPKPLNPKEAEALAKKNARLASLSASIDRATSILDEGLMTGPIVGAIAERTGIKSAKDQEYEAEVGGIVSELRALQKTTGSGADSDRELAMLLNQAPSLKTHPEAARQILARLKEKAQLYGGGEAAAPMQPAAPAGGSSDGWSIEPL